MPASIPMCFIIPSSTIIGISVSYADEFNPLEIIPVSSIVSPLALVSCHSHQLDRHLWFAISLDRVSNFNLRPSTLNTVAFQSGSEPDAWDEDDEG